MPAHARCQLDIHPNQLLLLAALPNLKRLSITLNPWARLNRPVVFRELRELEVFSADLSAIGALITHRAAPHLQAFSLAETQQEGSGSGRRLAKDLSVHLHTLATKRPALVALQWRCNLPRVDGGAGAVVGAGSGRGLACDPLAELVAPLLSLRALRSFAASFYGFLVEYSPPDFRAIAAAWPALKTFRLCDDTPRVRHHTDLATLVAFARHCPRLPPNGQVRP